MEFAILVYVLRFGEPVRHEVPWAFCVEQYRQWRYLDATGARVSIMDTMTGAKAFVREVRCEDRNNPGQGVPIS